MDSKPFRPLLRKIKYDSTYREALIDIAKLRLQIEKEQKEKEFLRQLIAKDPSPKRLIRELIKTFPKKQKKLIHVLSNFRPIDSKELKILVGTKNVKSLVRDTRNTLEKYGLSKSFAIKTTRGTFKSYYHLEILNKKTTS